MALKRTCPKGVGAVGAYSTGKFLCFLIFYFMSTNIAKGSLDFRATLRTVSSQLIYSMSCLLVTNRFHTECVSV